MILEDTKSAKRKSNGIVREVTSVTRNLEDRGVRRVRTNLDVTVDLGIVNDQRLVIDIDDEDVIRVDHVRDRIYANTRQKLERDRRHLLNLRRPVEVLKK